MKQILIFLLFPLFLNAQSFVQVAHANGPVYAIAKHGNMTIIGGKFTTVNGVPAQNIAWSTDQITWHAIGLGINDTVKDIAYFNGDFFIAGTFTQADTGANKFIVRWNPTTHHFTSIIYNQYYLGRGVSNLVAFDSVLYASGQFWSITNSSTSNMDGSIFTYSPYGVPYFTSQPWLYEKIVYAMTSYGNRLYAQFDDQISGLNSAKYCSSRLWSTTTWQWMNAFYASGYKASSMAVLNGSVYTGNQSGIMKYDSLTTLLNSFTSSPTYSLYATSNTLYMGGSSVTTTTGSTIQTAFSTNGKVLRMMYDTVMYFAGSFDSINGSPMGNVVKYQALTPVHAIASYDSVICAGGSVAFTSLSTGSSPTVSWTFSGGSPSTSVSNTPIVSFSAAGNHQVRLIVSNATSSDTAYYTIHVGTPITLTAPSQVTYCQGSMDTVSVGGFSGAFTWNPNNGIINSGQQFIFNTQSSNRYTIYASSGGCSDSITVNVNVNPLPATPTISQVDSHLVSSAVSGNQWYYSGNVLNGSVGQILIPTQNGGYTVMVTDGNGCTSSMSQTFNYTKPIDTVSTGLGEVGVNEIITYPNPVTTVVYIKGSFDLVDVNGKQIGSYKDEAVLSQFPAGIYFAISENFRRKIIKQ